MSVRECVACIGKVAFGLRICRLSVLLAFVLFRDSIHSTIGRDWRYRDEAAYFSVPIA